MKWAQAATCTRQHLFATTLRLWTSALGFATLLASAPADSQLIPCSNEADTRLIANALLDIQQSVDPCGESAELIALMEDLRGCTKPYRICSDLKSGRNVFDRPIDPHGEVLPRTITWNPELRSELELGCDGDPRKPVQRDPAASLLHELVHAVQDCKGLNPGEHEFEAVRVENIYRRAAGLCQRRTYGDDLLPPEMVRICSVGECPCSTPGDPGERRIRTQLAAPEDGRGGTAASDDARSQNAPQPYDN